MDSLAGLLRTPVGLKWLFIAAGLMAGAFALLGQFGRLSWLLDLLSNFTPQYALGLLVCALGLLMMKEWLWASALLPFLILCLAILWPVLWPPVFSGASPAGKPLRLLVLNVLGSNRDVEGMRRYIESESPDFVVLLEVTPKWSAAFDELSKGFEVHVSEPHEDNFGLAVLGRFKGAVRLERTQDEFGLPIYAVDFKLPDGKGLRLVSIHALVAKTGVLYEARSRGLWQAAALCKEASTPAILAGDFNMTPWSPLFRDLLRDGGLANSQRGRGLQLSWPSWSFWPLMPLAIPLDHCLHTPGVEVAARRLGSDVGSDHFPVVLDFTLSR